MGAPINSARDGIWVQEDSNEFRWINRRAISDVYVRYLDSSCTEIVDVTLTTLNEENINVSTEHSAKELVSWLGAGMHDLG